MLLAGQVIFHTALLCEHDLALKSLPACADPPTRLSLDFFRSFLAVSLARGLLSHFPIRVARPDFVSLRIHMQHSLLPMNRFVEQLLPLLSNQQIAQTLLMTDLDLKSRRSTYGL